jgi:DNA-directed RNA polymerase subunit omega
MARVTVEDCLEQEENRFALVILAAARTRQLMKGAPPLVRSTNKPSVTSLREIAAGKVHFDDDTADVVNTWVAEQQRANARRMGDRERQLRSSPDVAPRRAAGR